MGQLNEGEYSFKIYSSHGNYFYESESDTVCTPGINYFYLDGDNSIDDFYLAHFKVTKHNNICEDGSLCGLEQEENSQYYFSRGYNDNKTSFLVARRELNTFQGSMSVAAAWLWAPGLFISAQQAYVNGLVGLFWFCLGTVSYTHLTLPTNREV